MMEQQVILDDLHGYWDGLRGRRIAPRRSDLDPNLFGAALEHIFFLESPPDGPMRIRLAGTRLSEIMGMEARGMPARAMFAPRDQGRADAMLAEVLDHPANIDVTMSVRALDGRVWKAGMLLRPLADDFGSLTRVLGCLVTEAPRSETELSLQIGAIRIDTLRETPVAPHASGFAEAQAPFVGPHLRAMPEGRGKPEGVRQPISRAHLRIVSSRD